jgi:hypothetical protein
MANIKVNIDVDSGDVQIASDKVLTLQQQIKVLRQELQKTPEGTKEFNALVGKLNDTRDAFDRVNIKGKEIFGTLGLIPGPIGEIAARTNSALDALKVFGSFNVNDLKAQFTALGADFKGALVTLGKLTGITSLYTTLNNALAASFVKVGVGEVAAAAGARAFSVALTATGVGAIVVVVGLLAEKLITLGQEYFNAASDADKLTAAIDQQNKKFKENSQAIDADGKLRIATLKKQGASEKTIRDEQIKIAKQTYDNARLAEMKAAEQATAAGKLKANKDNEEAKQKATDNFRQAQLDTKNALANLRTVQADALNAEQADRDAAADKQRQKNEKNAEKLRSQREREIAEAKALREKELDEINKGRDEAFLERLGDQEAELYKVTDHYVRLIELASKYGMDTTIFEEAMLKKLAEIRDKYRKTDEEKQNEIDEKAAERLREYNKRLYESNEQIKTLNQQRVDDELRQNQIIGQSWINLGNNISTVFGSLANAFGENEVLQKAFAVAQVAINTAASIGSILLSGKQQQADYSKSIAAGNSTILLGLANAFIPGMQGVAAAQIASGKAAVAAGVAGKATAATNTKLQAATAGIVGAAQIAAILTAKKSAPSSGGGGGDTGGGASTPAFATPTIGAPQIGPTANQQGQLAGIVAGAMDRNNSQGRPLRAYVVGNDITTEQQLQRRIRTAARLGG